jgi:hypothetical protein
MFKSKLSDINSSEPKACKQLLTIGEKYLVFIDKSIIEKLGITENSTVFLEQEITHDKTILMKLKFLN